MTSWRTHAFGSNEQTIRLLKNEGVKYLSDLMGDIKPFEKFGLIHLPISIPPDNNAIAYGALRPENRDPFVGCTKGRIRKRDNKITKDIRFRIKTEDNDKFIREIGWLK